MNPFVSPSPSDQKAVYRYWRIRMMYSMMIGYAGFYLLRQNFTMAIPSMQSELGYSKIQIGAIISVAAIVYGLGKAISGLFSDRSNARYFMSFGLLMSAMMTLLMGLSSSLALFMVIWTLNSVFQSMGWPPCARLLTHWFSPREIATKWALWNMSQQVGGGVVLLVSPFLIHWFGWRSVFYVPGIFCIFLVVFLFNRLRDTPQSLGLPSIEAHQGIIKPASEIEEDHLPLREIILDKVLKNKLVWYVSFANFFLYIVRMAIFNWAPTFLREFKGSSLLIAGWQAAAFDLAGMFGGIFAGYLSDKVFHGHRGQVGAIFMVITCLAIILLWKSPSGALETHFFGMTLIGFLVSGPQILVGVAATDFASKKAAGAASGLTGTFGYLGTAVTGVGIGAIVDYWGWDYAFFMIAVAAILSAVFLALTWNHRAKVLEDFHQKAAA